MSDSNPELDKVEERRHDQNSRSLDKIEVEIKQVGDTLKLVLKKMDQMTQDHVEFLIWKNDIKHRLEDGDRIMKDIKAEVDRERTEHIREVEKLRAEHARDVEKLRSDCVHEQEKHTTAIEKVKETHEDDKKKMLKFCNETYIKREHVKYIVIGFTLAGGAGGFGLFKLLHAIGMI